MGKSKADYMRERRRREREEKLETGVVKPQIVFRSSTQRSRDWRQRKRQAKLKAEGVELKMEANTEDSTYTTEKDCFDTFAETKHVPIQNWNSFIWICYHCNLNFNDFKVFKSHIQSAHKVFDAQNICYQCRDCKDYLFSYSLFLNHHRSIHYESLKLCCDVCNEILPDYGQLSVHRDKHVELSNIYPIVYHCTLCEMVHASEKELKTHYQFTHNLIDINQDSSIQCKEEPKTILKDEYSPMEPIQCIDKFVELKNEHHEIKQTFQCSKCVQEFFNETDLETHMNLDHKRARHKFTSGLSTQIYFEFDEIQNAPNENWNSIAWICYQCHLSFNEFNVFRSHLQSAHGIIDAQNTCYQCRDCKEFLLSYASFLNHLRITHHESLKLCCDVCNEILPDYEQLSVHRDKHMELSNIYPMVYHCTLCEMVHSNEKELKNHIQLSHNFIDTSQHLYVNLKEEPSTISPCSSLEYARSPFEAVQCKDEFEETKEIFQCGKCVFNCNNETDLEGHMKSVHDKSAKNKFQSKMFYSKNNLQDGKQMDVPINNWKSIVWICYHCNLNFNGFKCFRYHFKCLHYITGARDTHYQCIYCKEFVFGYASFLNHLRGIHHEALKLCCDVCSKILPDYKQLSVHRDGHVESFKVYPKVYHCTLCEMVHSSEKELKDHIQLTHNVINPNQGSNTDYKERKKPISLSFSLKNANSFIEAKKPFRCKKCLLNFTNETDLKLHMTTHFEKALHMCKLCHKVFPSKSEFETHIVAHCQYSLHQCESCLKMFSSESKLEQHRQVCEEPLSHPKSEKPNISKKIWSFNQVQQYLYKGLKPNSLIFHCNKCWRSYKSKYHFKNHSATCKG